MFGAAEGETFGDGVYFAWSFKTCQDVSGSPCLLPTFLKLTEMRVETHRNERKLAMVATARVIAIALVGDQG